MDKFKLGQKFNIKLAIILSVALVLIIGTLSAALFFTGKVKVTYGTKVVCKYGHVVDDNTKTREVPRYLAKAYRIRLKEIVCADHKKIEKLHAKAEKALEKGDKKAALKMFEEIARLDPKFKDVTKTIGQLTGKIPEEGDQKNGSGGSKVADDDFQNKDSSLSFMIALLPEKLDGYKTLNTYEGDLNAGRYYEPVDKKEKIRLLVSVRDSGRKESAEDYLNKNVYLPYSEDSKKVTINKVKVYFGTDGREFAIMGWEKSGIVYQSELAAASGKNPANLLDDLEDVVKQFI